MRAQSDYNESKSIVVSRNSIYSDLDLAFGIHPVYKDVLPINDIDAVKNSIKNLVLTNYYERPFQPDLGGNISALLFENGNAFTAYEIQERIADLIEKYETRVEDVTVNVVDDIDVNAYRVTIRFTVINRTDAELVFYLTRIR
jgi:phage baseplate assembly protein W